MAPPLTQSDRQRIIALRKRGFKVVEIERNTGISRKTIYFWMKRWEEAGDLTSHHRQIYQRATTADQDEAIVAAHTADPNLSTRVTSSAFNVSLDTVRRRLMAAGRKCNRSTNKVSLKNNNHNQETIKNEEIADQSYPNKLRMHLCKDGSGNIAEINMNNVQMKQEILNETNSNEDEQIRNIRYIKHEVLPIEVDTTHSDLNCEINFNNTIVKKEIDNETFANEQNGIANIKIKKEPADLTYDDEFSQENNFNNVTAKIGNELRNEDLKKKENQSFFTHIKIKVEPIVPEENAEVDRMKSYECVVIKKEREESPDALEQDAEQKNYEVPIEENSNKYDDSNSDGSDYVYDSEEDIDTEESEDGNASEDKNMYPDHEVKDEMTIEPTLIGTTAVVPGVQNIRAEKKKEPHVCQTCNDTFTSLRRLKEHTRSHADDKYACDICSKRFNESRGLKRHRRTHILNKTHTCDVCNKMFGNGGQLKRHARVHTSEQPYSCDVCLKRFKDYSNWKRHARLHTGEKPYACDICSKRFRDAGHLKCHTRVHTDEKPFVCHICTKGFKDDVYLKRHIRLHTGETPHECEVCKKRFKDINYLKRHARVHIRVKNHVCTVCTKRFRETDQLKRHMLIHNRVKSVVSGTKSLIRSSSSEFRP